MNKEFLHRVLDQIMSETMINNGNVFPLFTSPILSPLSFFHFSLLFHTTFLKHCKDVYSLNDKEIEYVWDKYKEGILTIINDKEIVH